MRLLYIILCLSILLGAPLVAQKKDTKKEEATASFRLKLLASREVKMAKGYSEIYKNLKPKLTYLYFDKYGKRKSSYSYTPRLDTVQNEWVWDVLPFGQMALEVDDIAFKVIRDTLLMNLPVKSWEAQLEIDSVLYTYQDRQQYTYLRGSLLFSQTFVVYFSEGEEIVNRDRIVELIPDAIRVQKMRYGNAFYVTIPTADTRTVDEIIAEQKEGRKRASDAYYLGPTITRYIELLQLEPNVIHVNPTFFHDEREPEMFDPKEHPKSEYLIKKELLQLTND
jgi:hypothetical protein